MVRVFGDFLANLRYHSIRRFRFMINSPKKKGEYINTIPNALIGPQGREHSCMIPVGSKYAYINFVDEVLLSVSF